MPSTSGYAVEGCRFLLDHFAYVSRPATRARKASPWYVADHVIGVVLELGVRALVDPDRTETGGASAGYVGGVAVTDRSSALGESHAAALGLYRGRTSGQI